MLPVEGAVVTVDSTVTLSVDFPASLKSLEGRITGSAC